MADPRDPGEPDDETVVDPDWQVDDETIVDPGWQPGPDGTRVVAGEPIVAEEIVEEEVEVAPRRLPTLWPWLLAFLLLVLGGLAAVFLLSGDDDEDRPATTASALVDVPVLVGMREEPALARAEDEGLETVVQRRPGNRPAGVVVAQQPQAGTEVPEGSEVRLTVSSGPPTGDVPDVVGQQSAAAITTLEEAGFRTTATERFDARPAGEVVEQQPAAGEELVQNGVVALVVSQGPEPQPVAVPDVVGSQASDASAALRDVGLRPNLVTVPSNRPSGTVVAQAPAPGAEVDEGTAVRLNVSAGGTATQPAQTTTAPAEPEPAVVPDAVGGPLADAARSFGDVGLKVSVQPVPSDEQAGTVIAQAQPAGTELERGDTVQVNVSTGPEPAAATAVPQVAGQRQEQARSRLASAGFEVLSIELAGNPSRVGVVLSQTPDGGAQIPSGSLVILYVGAS